MIRIYEQGYNDFSTNGLGTLSPARCLVREEQGGRYELELEHPMDDGGLYDLLKNGRIIKAPVPAQTTPMHRIKGVADKEYWKATSRKSVYSMKSTDTGHMESVTKTKTVLTEQVLPRVAASHAMGLEYVGNHPRDTGTIYKKKPVSYTEDVWVPGPSSILTSIPQGEEFLILDKSDSAWLQVAAKNGTEGFIQRSGTSHSRTVPGIPDEVVQEKKIRDQLFRIYRTEKDTDSGEVKAWARHVYYDLLGNVLMDALYETVDLEELLPQLEVNCSQPDHGFRFFTDEPALEVNDLDYTHKNMVEAHLDPEEGLLNKGNLRMVRDNFSVYFTGRSQLVRAPITYGRNLLGVSLEINEDAVVNRIIPLGQDKDGEPVLLDEKWVDSPSFQEGDLIRAKAIEYSEAKEKDPTEATENSPGDPGMSIAQVKEKLLELALEEYDKGIDLPEIELEVDFIQLGDTEEYAQYRELDRLYLSDLTQITDLTHGIDVEAEVTEYEYDCLTSRYTKIKVGVTSAGRTIGSVDGFMLPNGGVAGTKIARGGVDASRLQNMAITSAKIGTAQIQLAHIAQAMIDQLNANALVAVKAEIGRLVAGEITTDELYANIAHIAEVKIGTAKIGFSQVIDLEADTALIQKGIGGKFLFDELAISEANIVSLAAGKIMLTGNDGNLYQLTVNESGTPVATLRQIVNNDVADLTLDAAEKLIRNSITANCLNVQEIFAAEALIGAIKAGNIAANAIETGHISSGARESLMVTAQERIELAVSSIQVGGRNLLKNTGHQIDSQYWNIWTPSIAVGQVNIKNDAYSIFGDTYFRFENKNHERVVLRYYGFANTSFFRVGDEYTVSFWARGTQPYKVSINDGGGVNMIITFGNIEASKTITFNGLTFSYYEKTAKVVGEVGNKVLFIDSNFRNYESEMYFHIQLEEGNKATPWKLADEDPASGVKTTYMEMLADLYRVYTGGRVELLAGAVFKMLSGSGSNYISLDNSRADGCFLFFGGETPESAPAAFWRDGTIKNVANSWVQDISENASSSDGVVMDFFFSDEVWAVDKVLLSIKFEAFRAYSTGAASGGGSTSGSGGGQTSGAGGGANTGGASVYTTSGASDSTTAHTHTMGHQHSVSAHTHSVAAHTHSVPDHTHGITYGIYKGSTPTSVTVIVDGTTVWTGQAAFINRDIAPYFSKTNGKITRNVFHTVELRPNTLGRISAHARVKTTEISKVAGSL